jgi:SMC interacting uncharacterized protein involved in chromosome segregation
VIGKFDEIRKLDVSEMKRLVEAICGAEEADRESVARDAASRVKDEMNSEFEKLRDKKTDALKKLEQVIGDEQFKDKRDRARGLQSKLNDVWPKIERLTESVRGGSNPAVAELMRIGQEAHREYQSNSSNCTVSEWSLGGGRADCIKASSCEVIEVKPNNSKAIYAGRSQARAYADVLNQSSDEIVKLGDKNSDFKNCQGKFKGRVACYVYCPDIDDEGKTKSTSMGWSMCD